MCMCMQPVWAEEMDKKLADLWEGIDSGGGVGNYFIIIISIITRKDRESRSAMLVILESTVIKHSHGFRAIL